MNAAVAVLTFMGAVAAGSPAAVDDESQLFGDWKGESIVVAKGTVAKDEVVVWHLSKGRAPGNVRVSADKIVNGRSIPMGTGEWQYDVATNSITWQSGPRLWKVTADGNTMKGTLTLPDGTVFRRVSLTRSRS
jgi:hypothetical protein